MGVNNLPDLAAAPTKVAATTSQYNKITNALQGHQVMRDSAGAPEDNASDIGRPSSGRPRKLYLGTGLNVNGQDIDLDSIALSTTGISSGKSKASGYPNFLTPEGATGGAENRFMIEAETTHLEMTIDGQSYTLETDLESGDLALAPGSNNTCMVDDSKITGDPEWSKTIGEFGYWINIDAVGSEIDSLTETIQCFSITNGVDTEVFIAEVDSDNTGATNRLIPIKRGIGGTDRIGFSDTDTITLLKAHYIFLDNDLATIDTTTTHPTWSATAPSSPATGNYWWDVANETWKRYSGASWEQLHRIYLGYAICDDADCLAVEHADYNLAWSETLTGGRTSAISDTEICISHKLQVSVVAKMLKLEQSSTISIIDNIMGGESEQNSHWYYLYIDNAGCFYLSSVCPRRKDLRLGWYHPSEYYRCIGMVYNDASSNLVGFSYEFFSGLYNHRETVIIGKTITTLSTLQVFTAAPPIVSAYALYVSVGSALPDTLELQPPQAQHPTHPAKCRYYFVTIDEGKEFQCGFIFNNLIYARMLTSTSSVKFSIQTMQIEF